MSRKTPSLAGWHGGNLLCVCVLTSQLVSGVTSQTTPQVAPPPTNGSAVPYDTSGSSDTGTPKEHLNCTLLTVYSVRDTLEGYLLTGAKLIEMDIKVLNYPPDFLQKRLPAYFRPHHWVRSTGRQGRSLLVLEDNYDFMSLFFLSIGVYEMNVTLTDSPPRCLTSLTPEQTLSVFRRVILNDFKPQDPGKEGGSLSVDEHVCNIRVKDKEGTAQFLYTCCHNSPDNDILCDDIEYDVWIEVLLAFILLTKILVVLYSPSFLPGSLYRLKYMAAQYVYSIPDKAPPKPVRLLITHNPPRDKFDPNKEKVVRLSRMKGMDNLKALVARKQKSGQDENVTLTLDKIRLSVKTRRLLSENDVPVGFLKGIYNSLMLCRIRHLYPLRRCCDRRILGKLVNSSRVLKWYKCCRIFARAVLLSLLILPWVIRMLVYYTFEEDFTADRKAAADRMNLDLNFQGSFTIFLTPLHLLFIVIYAIFIVDSLVFGLISKAMKEKMKFVLRDCLRDMRERSRIAVCAWVTRLLVVPFDMCGVFGFLVLPIYLALLLPIGIPVAAFYLFPALNLTVRLLINFSLFMCPAKLTDGVEDSVEKLVDKVLKKLDLDDMDDPEEQQPVDASCHFDSTANTTTCEKHRLLYASDKRKKFQAQFSKPPKHPSHKTGEGAEEEEGELRWTDVALQLLIIPMCLVSFWSVTLLLMEVVSFFVEMGVYTLMGIIVNAGSTLKYLTVVFMVGIYGQSTFSDVRKKYLAYHRDIHKQLLGRKRKEIEEVAQQDAEVQQNTAFRLHDDPDNPADDDHDIELVVKDGKPHWRTHSMLMFLDKKDTPYTPEKFFYNSITLDYYGAPGPMYLSMIAAFQSFSYILLFLFFVFIVVMAFGDAYSVSSTNQLLATVAGGFIPLLFRFIFKPASSGSSLDADSVQFKVEFARAIREYYQFWPLADIVDDKDVKKDPGAPRGQPVPEGVTEGEQSSSNRQAGDSNEVGMEPVNGGDTVITIQPCDESERPVDMIIDVSSRHSKKN